MAAHQEVQEFHEGMRLDQLVVHLNQQADKYANLGRAMHDLPEPEERALLEEYRRANVAVKLMLKATIAGPPPRKEDWPERRRVVGKRAPAAHAPVASNH